MLVDHLFYDVKNGTAATNNLPDRFDDLPKHDIEVFQSECIQNILDARSQKAKQENLPVEIDFIFDNFTSDEIADFSKLVGKDFFEKIVESYEKSDSQDVKEPMSKVYENVKKKKDWLALRIIEHNTSGLQGNEDPNRQEGERSSFDALMRAVNKTDKDEAISGGTWGKGSSVYTYSSGLWMWFAYSVPEKPWIHKEPLTHKNYQQTTARFMGRGIIAPFVDHEKSKTFLGHRWFCREENALPFINDEAHEMAKAINLPIRSSDNPGTSYFIPAFHPDEISELKVEDIITQFKFEIIKRWFIPIFRNELTCRLKSQHENFEDIIIDKEFLQNKVPELRYKLEILEWYFHGKKNDNKIREIDIITELPSVTRYFSNDYPDAKQYRNCLNHLVVRKIESSEKGFKGFNSVNRIALTRNNGMIINHFPFLDDEEHPEDNPLNQYLDEKRFEAIFFAGKMCNSSESFQTKEHMDLFLSFSENPAHNMWISHERDLGRCRLKRFNKNPAPYPWNRVDRLYKSLLLEIKKLFPKEDNIPIKKDICSFWKKLAHLPVSGTSHGGAQLFHFKTLKEEILNGKYYWKIQLISNSENVLKIGFDQYLQSLEPTKEKDFDILGISEFKKMEIYEDGEKVESITLEPENKKIVEIYSCNIQSNSLFKNLQPIIELKHVN